MDLALILAGYAAYALFFLRIAVRFFVWSRGEISPGAGKKSCPAATIASIDIFFLRRLFLVNKILWPGEWLFHAGVVLVFLRHLRYIIEPVPGFIEMIQPAGVFGGYLLVAGIVWVLIARFLIERGRYLSGYNVAMSAILLLAGVSGLAMWRAVRIDIVAAKTFVLRGFALDPGPAPADPVFVIHFLLACLFVAIVPTHILTAPATILDARRREEETAGILHDDARM